MNQVRNIPQHLQQQQAAQIAPQQVAKNTPKQGVRILFDFQLLAHF